MAKKEGLNGWLQRVRTTGEYSDLHVRLNGEEFHLHMLPLLNASSYFRNLPSSSEEGSKEISQEGYRVVTIPDLPGGVQGFGAAVDICYLIKPSYTPQNVSLIRAAAEFLGMDEILESTKKYMYANIFTHWRLCINFLQQYERIGSPVDEYVESRCRKVLFTACSKAFAESKHLSAPSKYISGPLTSIPLKRISPCQNLSEILVHICSLPDIYALEVIDMLVEADVNLNLKCRQGRNVRSWLNSVIEDECQTDRSRCWVLLFLSRMLLKGAPAKRPWMELSSQYWCSLLEHVDHSMERIADGMKERLMGVKTILEEKLGESLEEIDEYLHAYRFGPETLLSLVEYFVNAGQPSEKSLEEIAGEVDGFLYTYAETGSVSLCTFLNLFKVLPSSSRCSHDTIYGAIEKFLVHRSDCVPEEEQQLWSLVDHFKLSPSVNAKALNNPAFLSQPDILESVLQHHSQELSKVDDTDGHHLRQIMQKVINASLKLLEENSRRSREIAELQKQYGELLAEGKSQILERVISDISQKQIITDFGHHSQVESETEDSENSETPSVATVTSTGVPLSPPRMIDPSWWDDYCIMPVDAVHNVIGSGRRRLGEMFRDDLDCSSSSY